MKMQPLTTKFLNRFFFCGAVSIITIYLCPLPPTSSHLHSLQVENCDIDRLLVDGDDKKEFRTERVNCIFTHLKLCIAGDNEYKLLRFTKWWAEYYLSLAAQANVQS